MFRPPVCFDSLLSFYILSYVAAFVRINLSITEMKLKIRI